jgi:hypothetical protein
VLLTFAKRHLPRDISPERHLPRIVIDRKLIFLFRPKTNIRQENAAEYLADNEYSALGNIRCTNKDKIKILFFCGLQLQVSGSCKLSRFIQRTETHSVKHIDHFLENLSSEVKSYLIRLFSFSAALTEYSFRPNIRPIIFGRSLAQKTFAQKTFAQKDSLSYMFILLRAIHQMFIDEAAYAE